MDVDDVRKRKREKGSKEKEKEKEKKVMLWLWPEPSFQASNGTRFSRRLQCFSHIDIAATDITEIFRCLREKKKKK